MTNFLHALVAVMAGNALYFLAMPYLPAWAQHRTLREDTGIAVDFVFCLVIFVFVKMMAGGNASRGRSKQEHRP